jgi:excisionase family DNA binding protein
MGRKPASVIALDLNQAAEALNCSVGHLRRQVRKGDLPASRIGRKLVVEVAEIKRFLTEKRVVK